MKTKWVAASELDPKKGLRAEDYIPSVLVERVQKVLARGVPRNSAKVSGKALKAKRFYTSSFNGFTLARLSDDTWCGTRNDEDAARVEGCIGGYNHNASMLMEPLRVLGLITKKEAEAFCAWYKHVKELQQRNHDVLEMQNIAKRHGYEVTKKEKP